MLLRLLLDSGTALPKRENKRHMYHDFDARLRYQAVSDQNDDG